MPYNLRPRKNRARWVKPPPDDSDDSSDEDVVVTLNILGADPSNKKRGTGNVGKEENTSTDSSEAQDDKKSQARKKRRRSRNRNRSRNKEPTPKTNQDTNPRTESSSKESPKETPLQRVIHRLMATYNVNDSEEDTPSKHPTKTSKSTKRAAPKETKRGKGNANTLKGFIIQDEEDDDDTSYDPDDDDDDDDDDEDDDEDEEGEYVMIGGGMMSLGNMFGKKSPYDVRLPPSKLTPELLEYLQNMPNILGKAPKPGEDIEEFRSLPKNRQKTIVDSVKQVANVIDNEEHPYFRILSLPIDANSKRNAMERQIAIMNAENSMMSESNPKARAWVQGFLSIPFGKYRSPPKRAKKDPAGYLRWASSVMDREVFGMDDAKDHILRYVAQMITNPNAAGNCLAFMGPPGTGKTSLIRNGLGAILNRPVHMIALGGNTDASVLEGHGYTYEGSVWGQITDILIRSKCMNPVIIFDELDKVSGTSKGEEIIGLLTHITDSTQNSAFQDKYFAGINIDLSRVLFVFTLNNKDAVNPVLLDRLRTVHTNGYNTKEKRIIGEKYLLPRLLKHYAVRDLVLTEDAWRWILGERNEAGVRNLKRDLETIVSRLNLLQLFRGKGIQKIRHENKGRKSEGIAVNEMTKNTNERTNTLKDTPDKEGNHLPKGVPKGIVWEPGKDLGEEDVKTLLEGRSKNASNVPMGMYC